MVGPDEPSGNESRADVKASHWEALTQTLRKHWVQVGAVELSALPHDVELSDRVLARIGGDPCVDASASRRTT